MRSRSDRDRELQLSWAHTVTLIHTDINFRVTDSVATAEEAIYHTVLPGFQKLHT